MHTPARSDATREVAVAASALLALASVAVLDWITGPHLSVSVFYMLPIAWVAWRLSGRLGQVYAVLGSIIWMIIDLLSQDGDPAISVWNTLVRLSFFVVVVALLDRTRKLTAEQRAMALIDPLTRMPNSRALGDRLQLELDRQRRAHTWLTIAYVDLDNFKQVNDVYGHHHGDGVLRVAAETMATSLRASDMVARIGGDEFALVLPETDERGATVVLQNLRQRLLESMRAGGWAVSASIGAVSFERGPVSGDEALRRADALMYAVKRDGRDAFVCETVQFES